MSLILFGTELKKMPLSWIYHRTMTLGKPLIMAVLNQRLKNGKEDPERIKERFGQTTYPRPDGPLMWVHVASVGEAQSMLPVIALFLNSQENAHVMVTSITRTSAELLSKRLPQRAFHQYLPVDRPKWVKRFLDYWHPDLILWAESELWPTLLGEINERRIPTALLNARMSAKSFKNWSRLPSLATKILSAFTVILTQTDTDTESYTKLGGRNVMTLGNIKYAAAPLPFNTDDLSALQHATQGRNIWLYASTHNGEEEIAARIHRALKKSIPDLLTIIIPRHPERRDTIREEITTIYPDLNLTQRTDKKILPTHGTDIYLAATLGELGLFYRLSPLSVIGRSLSKDGGGGHNPLEAAQIKSAVIHGNHVQNLADIFTPMDAVGAAVSVKNADELLETIEFYLKNPANRDDLAEKAYRFAKEQDDILVKLVEELEPLFLLADLPILTAKENV